MGGVWCEGEGRLVCVGGGGEEKVKVKGHAPGQGQT